MQQAIDILERIKLELSCGIDPNHCTVQFAQTILDQGISRIQALGDGWIQTSIRLPEPHKNVLLWEGGYEPLELNEPIIGWYDTRYGFRTKGDGPIATHWMPLPLPPKQ